MHRDVEFVSLFCNRVYRYRQSSWDNADLNLIFNEVIKWDNGNTYTVKTTSSTKTTPRTPHLTETSLIFEQGIHR